MEESLKESESGYIVKISIKGPDGKYSDISYADIETSIDYEEGIYGYDVDAAIDCVSPMDKEDALIVLNEIITNAPDDVQATIVPYSEIRKNELTESDMSIYNAHAQYEKDQLKKKEEDDNQENFTFDEGSISLTTIYESILKEKQRRSYPTYNLSTLTPDGERDLEFSVEADVRFSDERDVGLGIDWEVEIDTSTVSIKPIEGYDTEQLTDYVIDLLEEDKDDKFTDAIYEQCMEKAEADYLEWCERENEKNHFNDFLVGKVKHNLYESKKVKKSIDKEFETKITYNGEDYFVGGWFTVYGDDFYEEGVIYEDDIDIDYAYHDDETLDIEEFKLDPKDLGQDFIDFAKKTVKKNIENSGDYYFSMDDFFNFPD